MAPRSKPSSSSNGRRRQKKENLRKKTQATAATNASGNASSDRKQQTTLPFVPVPGPRIRHPPGEAVDSRSGEAMLIDPPSKKLENPPVMVPVPSLDNPTKLESSHASSAPLECPVSRRDFAFLMKLVTTSRSFEELQEKFDIHLRFDNRPQRLGQAEAGIQPGSAVRPTRRSLHRLLAVVRAGKQAHREEAYKVMARQWVRLAQHKAFFPVKEEEAAMDVLDDYIEAENSAPLVVKLRINAILAFLKGCRLDEAIKHALNPHGTVFVEADNKWDFLDSVPIVPVQPLKKQKQPQHPDVTSGQFTRLAMDENGKARFICIAPECLRSYSSLNCIARHQVCHFELFACPACPQSFYSRTDHIQKHWDNSHPNRPRRDLEKTLELMYRNGGAPPALKMWVNGVVWGRKKDNVSRRRDLKRKKLDELRASERKSYERQSAAWARHRGLAPPNEE